MFRACLAFAFVLTLAMPGFSQTNSEDASKASLLSQPPPVDPKVVRDSIVGEDSLKSLGKKRKSKAKLKAAVKDSSKAGVVVQDSARVTPPDSAKALGPLLSSPSAAPVADSVKPALPTSAQPEPAVNPSDSSKSAVSPSEGLDTAGTPFPPPIKAAEIKRPPQDIRLFNDPTLIAKEYGFGVLGSLVAGSLGFFIGSGIETAIQGESDASKGTLKFTGIRYDNYSGAFWGGATGIVLGSALTTYFVGQTEEENGGLLMTLAGTAAAGAGAFYIAHLLEANENIDWVPFIPLLAIPSLGGTLGFNVSRWFNDRKREEIVGHQAAIWLHPPGLAWGRSEGGDRLEVRALNLTF